MKTDAPRQPARVVRPAERMRLLSMARGLSVLTVALVVAVSIGLTLRPRAAPAAQSSPMAPDFSLPVVSNGDFHVSRGGTLTLRALRGRPVLLSFFLSTCGPCLDELPLLRQAEQLYRVQGLVVVGVATLGDTEAAVRQLVRAAHLTYPVVMDNQGTAWQYGVAAVPTSVFVDARGHVVGQHIGPLDQQTIRDGMAQVGAIQCQDCGALEPLSFAAVAASSAAFSADFTFAPPKAAPFFALPDQQGRVVSPAALGGHAVALTFISSVCKEQCVLIGQTLSRVRQQLGPAAQGLSIVAVSVDPEDDTPRATRAFAAESGWRGMDWHYLTASRSVLTRVWSAYGMYVPRPPPIYKPGRPIVHQAGLFLLDSRGRLRAYYDTPFFAPRVAATVRALLAS